MHIIIILSIQGNGLAALLAYQALRRSIPGIENIQAEVFAMMESYGYQEDKLPQGGPREEFWKQRVDDRSEKKSITGR